jgi:transposase
MARFSLNDLKVFLADEPHLPYWMGIDVHKRSYHIALLRDDSTFTWSASADPEKLVQTINDFEIPLAGICYEAGPTGFSLARLIVKSNIPVIVAAPSKVPRSVSPGSKTDRLDCLKLAHFASKGLIKPIAIPTVTEESQRALLRRRHQLVDSIRQCKQRIKGMFLYHGFEEPAAIRHWRADSLQQLRSESLPKELKLTLNSHVRELKYLQDELSKVMKQLNDIGRSKEHQETLQALKSVPGVGTVVATSFLLEMFNPKRFSRGEEVASYLGLAPTVHHSGEKSPRGHLVPVGQTRLRSLLVESAWVWMTKDQYARQLYNKLIGRTGIPQKAITALARKLSIILWRLSIEQRAYRPVGK